MGRLYKQDHGERIATLEANQKNTSEMMSAVFNYMKEGRQWREDISKTLAVVVNNQQAMSAYQERCDADRDNLEHDNNELEKRISSAENFQRGQLWIAGAIGTIASAIVVGGQKGVEKIIGLFS